MDFVGENSGTVKYTEKYFAGVSSVFKGLKDERDERVSSARKKIL
mgnify:CR=1 FL=1